jgi:hypothetical protein
MTGFYIHVKLISSRSLDSPNLSWPRHVLYIFVLKGGFSPYPFVNMEDCFSKFIWTNYGRKLLSCINWLVFIRTSKYRHCVPWDIYHYLFKNMFFIFYNMYFILKIYISLYQIMVSKYHFLLTIMVLFP